MSKSYTINGQGTLSKCLVKATENACKAIVELNDINIISLYNIIGYMNSISDIVILLNINPDEKLKIQGTEIAKTKDKIELLGRYLDNSIVSTQLSVDMIEGISKISKLLQNNRIKIFINIGTNKKTQYFHFTYTDNTTRDIIADIFNAENEICVVTLYSPYEDTLNTLSNQLESKINQSGLNCVNDVLKLVNEKISINTVPAWEVYRKALFEINRHHINTYEKQYDMLSNLGKAELRFQSDGVDSLISILLKYNIAYLADSVGLGKTIIALRLLAKTSYNALIVTPNEIVAKQWKEYIDEPNDIFKSDINIHFCINSYQDLEKFIKTDSDYDIVIFDEAQNFRNINTLRYEKAQEICVGKKVLLIGATPINNSITDMEAQLMLGLDANKAYDFGVGKIGEYFAQLRKLTNKSKKNTTEYKKVQKLAGSDIRKNIISKIMIRRTRSDIERYYKQDIDSGKLHFPVVSEPQIIKYTYDGTKLANTLDILSGYNFSVKLTYAMYNSSRYLKKKKNVDNSVENVESDSLDELDENLKEINMTGLTKVRLIKLLDSSPEAFINSLYNMLNNIEDKINYLTGYISKEEMYTQESLFNSDSDYDEEMHNKGEYTSEYLVDLENDKEVILRLIKMWSSECELDQNVKVAKLIEILNNHSEEKIIIFTEFVTTAQTLYNKLSKLGYKVLKVDGTDNKTKSAEIMNNFSISGRNLNDYNILVSTNILSEGINLNRASVAINYDITWNPMIVIQRVGRLNRIDSIVRSIKVYNFFPCDEMDSTILSESNIISKFALASYSLGTDENYLISSDSDDIASSMLDYKKSIVDSIQHNILEEQLDFKTVDFRYAEEANRLLGEPKELDSLVDSAMYISCKARQNELPAMFGIFSAGGRIITAKYDTTGQYYIDYNTFLDVVKSHINDDITSGDFNFSKAFTLSNSIRNQNVYKNYTGTNSKAMLKIIDRLLDNLEESIEYSTLTDQKYARYKMQLEHFSKNIINGLVNDYLCRIYKDRFTKIINSSDYKIADKLELLFKDIPKRLYSYNSDYSYESKFKIIAVIDIAD